MSDSWAVIAVRLVRVNPPRRQIKALFHRIARPFLSSIHDVWYLFWCLWNKFVEYAKMPQHTGSSVVWARLGTVQAYNALCKQQAVCAAITLSSKTCLFLLLQRWKLIILLTCTVYHGPLPVIKIITIYLNFHSELLLNYWSCSRV